MPTRRALRLFTGLLVGASLLVLTAPSGSAAQDPAAVQADTVYHLELADGSTFNGYIIRRTPDLLVFRTLGGVRLELDPSQVRVLEPARGRIVEGQMWEEDPNATRLFFGPTARSMEAGEGYVGLFELFFFFGAVGAGDRVVLAGGTPILPEAIGQVFYLAPKVRALTIGELDLAVGGIAFFATEAAADGSLGVVYAVGTHGGPDNAVTGGVGYGFALGNGDAELSDEPVLMLGGEQRLSRRVKLLSENYVFLSTGVLLSGGLRLIGDRFSADLGLGALVGGGETFCCLPVLSAAYSF